ncbi:E3 ubiquitin-protein ligase TRIM71-like [Ruditapes philippinarum]|uniref:E3 ubiquitin-protein ligase TRIM71-like n=1 Tax=Ruditapes philippinarum TaxID=129788 RepID=UPI00295B08D4|nr:E3 ubiquitin-protein ligase TRIM71-like [Ruditapes philippinarum]
MEVPGKTRDRAQGLTSSSESSKCHGVLCQPCKADGESLEADGFCQNCQEYLCKTCIKYHRKVTVSKHHTILEKANMPKNVEPQTVKQLCTETCEKHKLEIIKYFCSDHDTVGCGNCMVIDHKTCKVEFIPDIADEFTNGEDYKAILTRLEKLQTKVDFKIKATGTGREACAKEFVFAVQEIKRFRKEIEDHLNKMEQTILKECERLRKENVNAITKNEDFLKTIKSELDDIADCLKSQSKKTTDLFVEAKQTEARLSQLEQDMKQNVNMVFTEYKFVRNSDLNAMVSGSCPLGKLSLKSCSYNPSKECSIAEFKPVYAGEIIVHSNTDKEDVLISNMLLLSSDALLCVDKKNNSVKVVDIKQKCISSQILLNSGPWDITFVATDQIAVTLPGIGKICFLSVTDKKLTSIREIKVNGECRGIAHYQNTLVVSFVGPPKLQILTLDGVVVRNITAGTLGWPGCVEVNVCGSSFFVSDFYNSSLMKFSFDGKLLATYQDESFKYPRSFTVCEDGSVLVCSSGNNTLHLVSQDCRKIKILPIEKNRFDRLQSVCFNEASSTLYLSNYSGNSILVYKQA